MVVVVSVSDRGDRRVAPDLRTRPRVTDWTRRRFIQTIPIGALAACGPQSRTGGDDPPPDARPVDPPPGIDPETIGEAPRERFPLGVCAGDTDASGAVLWTRYAGDAALGAWLWPEGTTEVIALPLAVADGGVVHVPTGALVAGAWYRYTFVESAGESLARGPIGRFRAVPEPDATPTLTFAASACTFNIESRFRTLERAGARTDLDAYFALGDTSYNDFCTGLDDYRERWAGNLEKAGYRAIRSATSTYATWDDHEVGNNWNPETIDPTLLATARQAFFEYQPLRRIAEAPERIWRNRRWGRTAEVFVLDCRSERRPSTRTTPGCEYLSRAQMDWLTGALAASPCVFKLVLNSVPISKFPSTFDLGDILLDPADRWDGYAAARTELLSFIETNGITGVVFVSGDFHLASCGRVSPSGVGRNVLEILAGPGGQKPNPLHYLLRPPQFDFATDENNVTTLRLDPIARSLRVEYWDGAGESIESKTYSV